MFDNLTIYGAIILILVCVLCMIEDPKNSLFKEMIALMKEYNYNEYLEFKKRYNKLEWWSMVILGLIAVFIILSLAIVSRIEVI